MSALSESTIRALKTADEDPVWSVFVDIICSGNEPLSSEGHEWSPQTLDAIASAKRSVQRSQELMEASIVSAAEVYGTFAEIQEELSEYVFDGPHSDTILGISCGPDGHERDFFVVTQFRDRYIALGQRIGVDGPPCIAGRRSVARKIVRFRLRQRHADQHHCRSKGTYRNPQ